MNLANDIQPITYMKSHAANLLQQVNETRRPVVITQNGQARAVLQDTASYESMRNTIALLKLMVQGEEDIRHGRHSGQDEVFARIRERLEKRAETV
ncbi:MAG: type II toxin-antitoxin system Phd/YefM family antitoxin [Geobacteraceae bacterium]|nr:type II toxin-antitoxin system Phd/YefM family antitoxin [Geobacteraceae bacterium]